jgi:predicted ester cyclase
MTRDDVLALLARRQDALAKRDMAAFGELYAESAELESPLAGSVRGREAIVRASWAFLTAFPDAVIVEDPPIVEQERAAVIAQVSGTDVGGIMGLSPSGRAFRFAAAFIFTVQDHLIVRERRIYDFTGLLVQVGALKAKPA